MRFLLPTRIDYICYTNSNYSNQKAMNFPELKDRRRIKDIYDSSSDRQIGLAVKMAKLITDSKKAERRWRV